MAKQVNYELMRVRLEYLYSLLNYNATTMQVQYGMSEDIIETMNSMVATIGINLIYVQRSDPKAVILVGESRRIQAIAQKIADKLSGIAEIIRQECDGLPKEAIADRYHVILQNGLDEIMVMLKKHIESEEVSNG